MTLKAPERTKESDPQGIVDPIQEAGLRASIPERVLEKVVREMMLKRLLTVPEAATYLGRTIDTVRRLIYRREFRIVQRGDRGKCYIDKADLDAWIERNKRFSGEE